MKISHIICLALALFLFSGCAESGQPNSAKTVKFDITDLNYKAADKLLREAQLPAGSVVIMATVVNIDDIENSSTLGRLISEHVSSHFTRKNMNMIEMKFRENVYMKQNEGELMLTREIGKIAKNHSANAIVVGTYALSNSAVYINLKIIDPRTNVAISATDYVLPMNNDISDMSGKKVRMF